MYKFQAVWVCVCVYKSHTLCENPAKAIFCDLMFFFTFISLILTE